MNAAELRERLGRARAPRSRDNPGAGSPRLELIAAERDVSRFLAGKSPPTELAASWLAEIIVRDRLSHEQVGEGYAADPDGYELACRTRLQRLRYRISKVLHPRD